MKKIILFFVLVILLFSFSKIDAEELEYNKIKVDIKGEVKYPGYYELDGGSTIYDAIKKAGGLNKSADTSIINLSKKLNDEDVIIIYSFDEVEKMKSGNTSIMVIEKECMCPKIDSVGCIKDIGFGNNLININTASKEELMSLSGIGESKAKLIIEYREKTPFKDIKDIMNIKGIGKSIFDKIKDFITV